MDIKKLYREANSRIHPDPTLIDRVLAAEPQKHRCRFLWIPAAALPAVAVVVCLCLFLGRGQGAANKDPLLVLQNNGENGSAASVPAVQSDTAGNDSAGSMGISSVSPPQSTRQNTNTGGMKGTASKPATAPGSNASAEPLVAVQYPAAGKEKAPDSAFTAAYRQFALKTTPRVITGGAENAVYSPAGFFMLSAMLTECTAGETQKELLSLLGTDAEKLSAGSAAFFAGNYLDGQDNMLVFANSYWVKQGTALKQPLLSTLAARHYAEGYTVPFGQASAPRLISQWVNRHTGGMLEADTEKAADDGTVLLLLNTLLLQGYWKPSFEAVPEQANFTRTDGRTMPADYIKCAAYLSISQENGLVLVDLPLQNGCVMRLALPPQGTAPAKLLADPPALEQLLYGRVESKPVKLQMPKFTASASHNFKAVYTGLGVNLVFDGSKADFTPLSDSRTLRLASLSQNICLTADEQGCKAAAFTQAAIYAETAADGEWVTLSFDRAFAFAVLRNGYPLIVGTVDRTMSGDNSRTK